MTEGTPYEGAEPMEDVREGMLVVDRAGEEIGTVVDMKMGDPYAVTGAGQEQLTDDQFTTTSAKIFGPRHEFPEAWAERMRRLGFLRLGQKMTRRELFAAGDQVAEVSAGKVHLNVDRQELLAA